MNFDSKRLASCEDSVSIYEKGYIENTIEDIKKDLRAKVPPMTLMTKVPEIHKFKGLYNESSKVVYEIYFYRLGEF